MDAVGPDVHVLLSLQGAFAPVLVFLFPDFLEPDVVEAESPSARGPTRAARASLKSPVLTPLRYSQGINSSMLLVFRRYGGRIFEEKGAASSRSVDPAPAAAGLYRAHAGRDRPLGQVAVADHLAMAGFVRQVRVAVDPLGTSASIAWASIRWAPSRRIWSTRLAKWRLARQSLN